MKLYHFPAFFHNAEEGGYYVTFPDRPECITEGDTFEEAYTYAQEALGLALEEEYLSRQPIVEPVITTDLICPDGIIAVVTVDMDAYVRKHNSKAVKKTLTIPEWLNEAGVKAGINFSQVLQEALIKKLDM